MIFMKKNNKSQLELPILAEISASTIKSKKKNNIQEQIEKLSVYFSDDVKAADSDDIQIYQSISNAYFRSISTQKR